MAYEIYIGNLVENAAQPVGYVELNAAPAFDGDDGSQHCNRRQVGFETWARFCRATGLGALFLGREGLFSNLPGTAPLTEAHAEALYAALRAYRLAQPAARPTFVGGEADHHLARLEWLVWWVDRAVRTCAAPAITVR